MLGLKAQKLSFTKADMLQIRHKNIFVNYIELYMNIKQCLGDDVTEIRFIL